MNYQSSYMYKPPYPVQDLPSEMQDFIQCIVASTRTPVELVAPVVLSAAAAAVQGVVDVKPPFGGSMPTSLFFGVVMRSGDRKSSVRNLAFLAFEEFEQGRLAVNEQCGTDSRSLEPQVHPFLIEKSTEQGVIDLFRQGARSVCYAPDEGGMYLANLDLPSACKRFDGGTIREYTQTKGQIVLTDRRASLCMLIQELTFNKFMSKKGDRMIESGFLPRVLMSFATRPTIPCSHSFASPGRLQNPREHPFQEWVRSQLRGYGYSLGDRASKREQLFLGASAVIAWNHFDQMLEQQILPQSDALEDVRPFVRRAGEQVLRLAAVLQWFSSPQLEIERWAVDAASSIVQWHLLEAKAAFGMPPLAVQIQRLSDQLYAYLLRKAQAIGQTCFARSTLSRCGPKPLRNEDNLSMAVHCLLHANRITQYMQGKKEFIVLNANSNQNLYGLPLNYSASHGAVDY